MKERGGNLPVHNQNTMATKKSTRTKAKKKPGVVPRFASVDEYINHLPEPAQTVVKEVRKVLHAVLPKGDDVVSYNIASIQTDKGGVLWYAGWKEHISFYPGTKEMEKAIPQLKGRVGDRGTIKFPLTEKIPASLIRKMVRFRLKMLK